MGQEFGRYHITEDGNIYCINNDSSYTYLGNVKDLARHTKNGNNGRPKSRPTSTKEGNVKKKSNSAGWIVFGILMYLIAMVCFIIGMAAY